MSLQSKFNKLKRYPILFLKDMKIIKCFQNIFEIKIEKEIKKEPLLYGCISNKNKLKIKLFQNIKHSNKKLNSLIIINDQEEYIINNKYISNILKEKNFIGFDNKHIMFFKENIETMKKILNFNIYKTFFTNELRRNNFQSFRNIININPMTPTGVILKNTNPFIKLIYIIDDINSLNYIKRNFKDINVLILSKKLKEEAKNIKINKIKYFENETELINNFKNTIIENIKKEKNVLLPIKCNTDNIEIFDKINKNESINGVIKFKKTNVFYTNFSDMIENMEIEEFYLKEEQYNEYKDIIFNIKEEKEYNQLLKKTLEDGVFYEKI